MDEAIEGSSALRSRKATEVALRQVFEAEDFGVNLPPELREQKSVCASKSENQKGLVKTFRRSCRFRWPHSSR